jgi:hypothetical protein
MRRGRARPAGFADHGRSPNVGMLPPRQVDTDRLNQLVARYRSPGVPAAGPSELECKEPADAS